MRFYNLVDTMILFVLLAFSFNAHAAVNPLSQDIKLPSQQMIEKRSFAAPLAASATKFLSAVAGPTSGSALVLTSFVAQPDVARNLVVTPGGTTAHLNACVIMISGTNIMAKPISETFTFTSTQSTAVTGAKAFASITSMAFPAGCEASAFDVTWSLGSGVKLGVNRCMDDAGNALQSSTDGVKDATAATIAASATAVESNTVSFNTAPNAAHNYNYYFMQNFRCLN